MVIGKNSQNTLAGISPPKAVILNIYMRGGEPSLLTQPMMIYKIISEMLKKQPNSWAMVMMLWSTYLRLPCQWNYMALFMAIITSHFFALC